MKNCLKLFSVFLSFCMIVSVFTSCSKKIESTPVNPEDFRVTAYIVGDTCTDLNTFDTSHFDTITDIILFGVATFDAGGNITLSDNFETCLINIRSAMKSDGSQNIYLNLLGPESTTDSDDWYEQMDNQAKHHTNAFESGQLETNIKSVLEKYGFDGVYFDYEYPIKRKYWETYNNFIISLDHILGADYKIGMALSDWDIKQSEEAKAATDFIEVMSYDNWDNNGNHSTMALAEYSINKFVKAGYDKAKLDLGVPFYARPTTKETFWYEYKSYYNKIDKSGLFNDENETGLVFSFNDYELIKEKTEWAINEGVGGIMVWHYSCDLPKSNDLSLFNAIDDAKQNAIYE